MAKEYDETNTFKLFVQDVEEGSKKPNLTGEINIEGNLNILANCLPSIRNGCRP